MEPESVKRKLTTILAADVEGYSRLMSADEEATLKTLKSYREIIDGLIAKHDGRIFGTGGDSVLAEFGSTVEAVRCAITVQEELRIHNAELAEEQQMKFRIGVNVGDVMVEGDNLYGDGVNVAARLEGVAEAGGICISGSAFEQVKDKLSIGFEDIGPQEVKNIAKPIPAFRVVPGPVSVAATATKPAGGKRWRIPAIAAAIVIILAAGGLAWWQLAGEPVEPATPSIAVLPFNNLDKQYELGDGIADGLASNITNALGTTRMFVISSAATRRYKNKSVPLSQIGEELGVRYLLEGDVQVFPGDKVRVTTTLIDAPTEKSLWTGKFDSDTDDALKLLDKITLSVFKALQVKIGHGEILRLNAGGTDNLEAQLNHFRALRHFYRFTEENNAEARRYWEKAVELDPNYATAVYMVGNTHNMASRFGWGEGRAQEKARAVEFANKALAIDPRTPGPYNLLAVIARGEGRFDDAIANAEKAIELSPNTFIYHAVLGQTLVYVGRPEEGLQRIQHGIRLNPFPVTLILKMEGEAYHVLGQYEEALKAFERARAADPKSVPPHVFLALTYADMGRMGEAHAAAQEVLKLQPNFTVKRFVNTLSYKDLTIPERFIATLIQMGLPE